MRSCPRPACLISCEVANPLLGPHRERRQRGFFSLTPVSPRCTRSERRGRRGAGHSERIPERQAMLPPRLRQSAGVEPAGVERSHGKPTGPAGPTADRAASPGFATPAIAIRGGANPYTRSHRNTAPGLQTGAGTCTVFVRRACSQGLPGFPSPPAGHRPHCGVAERFRTPRVPLALEPPLRAEPQQLLATHHGS